MGDSGRMLKIIKTFDGTDALANNCRHIKGDYYEMNRQCFKMPDGKWHRVNNGLIDYDHEVGKWVLIGRTDLFKGIVSMKGSEFIYGRFSPNPTKNTFLHTLQEGKTMVIDASLLEDNSEVIESSGDGNFYTKDYVERHPEVLNKKIVKYRFPLDYGAAGSIRTFSKAFNLSKDDTLAYIENTKSFYKELGDIKWGAEFETWNGTVIERYLKPAGLIPLRDGSLSHDGVRSYEYATIPLSGLDGLKGLKHACNLLTKYTEINPMCSLHLHISGYQPSKEFVVGLFILAQKLETDIFSLFPKYFENTGNFKKQSYCGKLPNVGITKKQSTEEAFYRIYQWLVPDYDDYPFQGFNVCNHPNDPGAHSKWYIGARYYHTNFVTFIWGNKKTVEFRVHPPSTNFTKTSNWLFITNAILKFVNDTDWKTIINDDIRLNDVLNNAYSPKLANYLIAYTNDLRRLRSKMDTVSDYTGRIWCKEDADYSFSYNGITELL